MTKKTASDSSDTPTDIAQEREARARSALQRGEFDLADQLLARENIELDSLVENLRIYQAELEIQNAELREAQAISERALDRFAKLFSHLPLALLVIDRAGQVLQVNAKASALFGLNDYGVHKPYLRRLIEPADEAELGRAVKCANDAGASHVDRMRFRDGNGAGFIGELHLARLPDEFGQDSQFACGVVDLSARIQAEARIAALAAVVEHSHDIIVVKDLDLRVVATNQAFAQASGHASAVDLIGKTDAEIFNMAPDQEPVRSYMADDRQAQTLPPGEFLLREEPVISPNGEVRQYLTRKYPIHDAAGVLLGSGNISVDISARKRTEELERFSAFQAGIAEMSTSVLHNVGNAITSVIQNAAQIEHASTEMLRVATLLETNASRGQAEFAGLLGSSLPAHDLTQRQFMIQLEAARAIRQLIEDTLSQPARRISESVRHISDMVHIQQSAVIPSSQRGSFSLTQAINSALEMQGDACANLGIQVALKVDPAVEWVNLSQNLMLQTLVNTLRNSIEAIEERRRVENFNGRIEIRAEAMADNRLRLTLSDNGIGFTPEQHASLFRFGYSTKPRGTGFGLPSVVVFAAEAGGRVTLESEGPGRGAHLVLEMPMQQGVSGTGST
jgi:PAS domain S-box-containing protein